jgi:hypothetical protein
MRKHQKRGLRFRRQLDRLFGVPLLWTLGKLRRPRSLPAEIHRVVILQTAAIGDTILMSQGIRRLRKVLPHAQIVLVLGRDNRAVAELLPRSDKVVLIDVLSPIAALQALRALKPDVLIDYGTWPRINAVLTRRLSKVAILPMTILLSTRPNSMRWRTNGRCSVS